VSSGRISGTIRNSLTFAIETDPTLAGYQRLIAGALLKPTSVKFGKDDASNYSFYLVPKDTTLIEPPVFGPLPDYDDSTETFELRNIPAGTYDLHVVFRPNTGDGFKWHAYSGRTIVNVGDLSVNVGEIQIEPNADVSGQIFLDGSPTVPRIDFGHSFPSLISAEPVPTDLLPGPRLSSNNFVEKDGTFRIPGGVPPGRYWVGFEDWRLPPGVYVDSATMDGRNELGAPVTIQAGAVNRVTFRLRGDGGSVLGIVSDRDRRVIPNATVVLLPVVQRDDASPFRSTSTNERGEFKIDGIRPDAYSLFAVSPGIPDSLLRDSAVVSSFSNQGKKLDVRRNDAIQMNLEAISRQ
jgi:hypothetical protein